MTEAEPERLCLPAFVHSFCELSAKPAGLGHRLWACIFPPASIQLRSNEPHVRQCLGRQPSSHVQYSNLHIGSPSQVPSGRRPIGHLGCDPTRPLCARILCMVPREAAARRPKARRVAATVPHSSARRLPSSTDSASAPSERRGAFPILNDRGSGPTVCRQPQSFSRRHSRAHSPS